MQTPSNQLVKIAQAFIGQKIVVKRLNDIKKRYTIQIHGLSSDINGSRLHEVRFIIGGDHEGDFHFSIPNGDDCHIFWGSAHFRAGEHVEALTVVGKGSFKEILEACLG